MIPRLLLFLTLMLTTSICKNIKLQLTQHFHYLILFSDDLKLQDGEEQQNNHLHFQIDFSSTNVVLSPQFKNHPLYLDKNKHKQINDKMNITYKTIKKKPKDGESSDEQEMHGIIGFKRNGQFIKGIKNVLNTTDLKLWFRIYENLIELVPQSCSHPLFGPYQTSIRTGNSNKDFEIKEISLNFYPKKQKFLSLLNKKQTPFRLQSDQMRQKIDLQLFNEIQSMPLKKLMGKNCLKYTDSQKGFECSLPQKKDNKEDDIGILLFQFDPIICTNVDAIELQQEGKLDSQGYYWGHIIMIIAQFSIVFIYKQHDWLDDKVDKLTQKYQ